VQVVNCDMRPESVCTASYQHADFPCPGKALLSGVSAEVRSTAETNACQSCQDMEYISIAAHPQQTELTQHGSKFDDLLTQRETALAKATTLSTTANISQTLHYPAADAPPYMMCVSGRDDPDRSSIHRGPVRQEALFQPSLPFDMSLWRTTK